MENFCKGALIGIIAGMCAGAVIVAKNKKLSGKIKDGLTTAEGKIKEIKEGIENKINCGCGDENCNPESEDCECESENCSCNDAKNNFSKKPKNY